jgi:acyl carrier protein
MNNVKKADLLYQYVDSLGMFEITSEISNVFNIGFVDVSDVKTLEDLINVVKDEVL